MGVLKVKQGNENTYKITREANRKIRTANMNNKKESTLTLIDKQNRTINLETYLDTMPVTMGTMNTKNNETRS